MMLQLLRKIYGSGIYSLRILHRNSFLGSHFSHFADLNSGFPLIFIYEGKTRIQKLSRLNQVKSAN